MRYVTIAAAACSVFVALRALRTSLDGRHVARATDDALDDRLADTFPASDPATTY